MAAGRRRKSNLPFRLAETNSCYQGGKAGVSDTFASALWGADFDVSALASAGGVGINFHGGGYGVYTPIAGTVASGFTARPIFYGMLLFRANGSGTPDRSASGRPGERTAGDGVWRAQRYGPVGACGGRRFQPSMRIGRCRSELKGRGRGVGSGAATFRAAARRHAGCDAGEQSGGASGAWDAARAEEVAGARMGAASIGLPAGSAALVTFHFWGTMRRVACTGRAL